MSRFTCVLAASLAVSSWATAQRPDGRPGYVPPGVEPATTPLPIIQIIEEEVDVAEAPAEERTLPKQIQYEITVVHLASDQDFSAEDQALTGENAVERLAEWNQAGKVSRSSTFRLSALEGSEALAQIGQSTPVVTARGSAPGGGRGAFTGAGGGGISQAVQYRETGTTVRLTGRVEGGAVVVECRAEESTLEESGVMPGAPPASEGAPAVPELPMTGQRQLQLQSTVRVPSGGTLILSGSFQKTKEGSRAVVATLSAKVVE